MTTARITWKNQTVSIGKTQVRVRGLPGVWNVSKIDDRKATFLLRQPGKPGRGKTVKFDDVDEVLPDGAPMSAPVVPPEGLHDAGAEDGRKLFEQLAALGLTGGESVNSVCDAVEAALVQRRELLQLDLAVATGKLEGFSSARAAVKK